MYNKLKLRGRIVLASAVPLLLFMSVAIVVIFYAYSVRQQAAVAERSSTVVEYVQDAELGTVMLLRGASGYLLSRDPKEKQAFENGSKMLADALEVLKPQIVNPEQLARLERLAEIRTLLVPAAQRLVLLVDGGKAAEAQEQFRTGEALRYGAEFTEVFEQFNRKELELLEAAKQQRESSLNRLILIMETGFVLAVIISLVLSLRLANRIGQSLSASVNDMTASTTQIAATMTQHERTMGQQSAAVSEITATAEELGVSAKTSAEQAERAATSANQALQVTGEGIKLANRAYSGMTGMKEKVDAVAEHILRLSAQADQIGAIAKLVGELAGETNMLALNAAVEAARAGEHGKGFAVVAGEVRKLADQSKKSAERANALVDEIQKATNAAVMVTEEGTRTVEDVAVIAQQAGEAFNSLTEVARNVYENAQQVMLNSKQQSAALSQVADAMKDLDTGAREMATGTVQTKIGVEKLNEVAGSLKAII